MFLMSIRHEQFDIIVIQELQCFTILDYIRGLPFSTYTPRGKGRGQVSYTFSLRVICKRGRGFQIACKIANVLNGRPLTKLVRLLPFFKLQEQS